MTTPDPLVQALTGLIIELAWFTSSARSMTTANHVLR